MQIYYALEAALSSLRGFFKHLRNLARCGFDSPGHRGQPEVRSITL